ncbi:hypothetical protein DICVIV_07569 [Dictyocaulus viviparus]|uniref:Uncharacterized protein n=1 Tax=Dictyocaulus viviparus TaxID=29172 RepID=A0A0D8XRL0_DICVI|nr:hypothetical protein DICVIV_07569 [Dictyocaulus viviparus]
MRSPLENENENRREKEISFVENDFLSWKRWIRLNTIIVSIQCREAVGVAIGFRPNCHPKPNGGCKCDIKSGGIDTLVEFASDEELATADNKKKLNEEINKKYGDFKENCFPKPSGGCKCNVDLGHGEQVMEYSSNAECRKSIEDKNPAPMCKIFEYLEKTAQNKANLNEEIEGKFGNFKENCFPKPSGGCRCNEKDAHGNEVVTSYNNAAECKINRISRDVGVATQRQPLNANVYQQKVRSRDPPRCLCVVGKTAEGRDITERRMKDSDCKCKEGERGPGCQAA